MTESSKRPDHSGEDAALVRQFQRGADPSGAIEQLFDRYGVMTYAFFCRAVGDRRIAEELNQNLYLEVIGGLSGFRGRSSFKTWLFRLAYNHVSNLRRRLRTHLDERPVEMPDELWGQLAEASNGSPEKAASDEQTKHVIQRCLARLPEIERAVMLGRYYEERTLDELTLELKLTNPSGARAWLLAAQRRLKKCLERAGLAGPRRASTPGRGAGKPPPGGSSDRPTPDPSL